MHLPEGFLYLGGGRYISNCGRLYSLYTYVFQNFAGADRCECSTYICLKDDSSGGVCCGFGASPIAIGRGAYDK